MTIKVLHKDGTEEMQRVTVSAWAGGYTTPFCTAFLKAAQKFLEKMQASGTYTSNGKNKGEVESSIQETNDTCTVCETERLDAACNATSISFNKTLPIEQCFASNEEAVLAADGSELERE